MKTLIPFSWRCFLIALSTLAVPQAHSAPVRLVQESPAIISRVAPEADRARLIVLADMGNEPDEEQQMTHMLVCSNEFQLEGLIAVTGKFLRPELKEAFVAKLRVFENQAQDDAGAWICRECPDIH